MTPGYIDSQAMSYLMTIVIHRLQETDPAWWQEFLGEMKADRNTVGAKRFAAKCSTAPSASSSMPSNPKPWPRALVFNCVSTFLY